MEQICGLFLLTGAYPLWRLGRGVSGTTLRDAALWVIMAWAVAVAGWSYLALALAACAGVAVLGARRPGVAAWNFVVVGLLAVLCRPYLLGLGELKLETAHVIILGGALAVGVGNYLPTRQGITAAGFGLWSAAQVAALTGSLTPPPGVMSLALGVLMWLALLLRNRKQDVWKSFRDAFGYLWAQRLREQFQSAATNTGLRVELTWAGLRGDDHEPGERLLRSMLRRFDRDPS